MKSILNFFSKKIERVFSSRRSRRQNSAAHNFHDFEKIITLSELYISGQVYLISLEHIKEELGHKWNSSRKAIIENMTTKIKNRTSEEDIFVSRSEVEYLVVFSDRHNKEAKQICGDILKELSITYLGISYDRNIILRTAIGKKQTKLLFKDVAYSSDSEDDSNNSSKPTSVPAVRLEPFVSPIRPKKKRSFELIYKPIWDKKNNIISTFMVSIRKNKPKNTDSTVTGPIGYNALQNPYCLASLIELDQFMLGEIVAMMKDFFNNNFRAMFSIPLSYKTLFNLTRLHNFLFHCQSIPVPLRKYINFSLSGFPDGFPEARMHQITTSLMKYCRDVTIVCDKIPQDITYYKGCGIGGICLNITEKEKKSRKYLEKIHKLADDCAKEKINLSLDGIDNFEELETMKETELNFISGNTIGRFSDAPRHMKHFKWKDIAKN